MLVVKKMHSIEYHILHFRRILHIQYVIPKKDEVVQACHMHDNRSSITTETPKAPKYTQIMLWSSAGEDSPGTYTFAVLIRLILTG